MKRKGVYLLLLMASLLSIGPAMSDARVNKVGSIGVLPPMPGKASRPLPPGD